MNERFVRLTPEDPETIGFEARSTTGDLAQTFDATAKRDGCVTIKRRYDRGLDNIHICDINHFIEFLQAVRDEGVKRFPDEWAMPEGPK